ncbi:hypothetical protein N0B44_19625 [Roseibacterium beibuensis]|uniref:hypothetical protein n=1 Tax=[Roseibacterium] beibuensis TaxID=1193142 RepID=UPI00217ED3A7|nr:hypothetical protein [Roseibacterium beibuensis]MCS6625127.1 hypothetical protein [Roseibacterium beibuensis]
MRLTAVPMLAFFALAACGERAEEGAPTPAEVVSATPAESDAAPSAPTVLGATDLRRVCRAGLAGIHGQRLEDISIDGIEGDVVNASWRAPVDGGRRRAQCRVEGDLITWKPADAGDPEQARWMNQSGDPVSRFVLDGDIITINTTLPDGTVDRTELTVPANTGGGA